MQNVLMNLEEYLNLFSFPHVRVNDIIDILIVSIIIYEVARWIRNTRAWMLFKGLIVLLAFTIVAAILQLHTIMWILDKIFSIGITAAIIIFQPELRRALESLGKKNIIANIFNFDDSKEEEVFDDKSVQAITKACVEMGKAKTGALIVMERQVGLGEYERTGIPIDSKITSQLLINIFEHNTPLHDGAVLIRNNRIVSATCYLPLTDSLEIGKELGTRHRAAIGISEVSDSITIVVSEETGGISIARGGKLYRNLNAESLKKYLQILKNTNSDSKIFKLWKGRGKNETKTHE
ncbi:diadenylate cyclase CdaA [Anaerostipes sp. 992a]|uniref:diadenylate cyclase CdaA n=1 Tax=Anaerostipes sp. 992a TaxID=1261637 RepID=UPI000A5FD898|nr:diadenylate cyclase CdaA [Anaerostipes sp. 992a]